LPEPLERAAERMPSLGIVATTSRQRLCSLGEGRIRAFRAHGTTDQREANPLGSQLEPRALEVLHAHLAIRDNLADRPPKDCVATMADVEGIGLPNDVMTGFREIADKVLSIA